ncbi:MULTISPECIES: hypothetical protein [Staphylococcus]|uniref:hypothetical protein n=1 Tax=Staphylococcus TaxID=1279 RepID=UPI0014434830|nr:hypothetical protein [Staphylococcus epidermidis]NKP41919.1 hypothetical protein [Staphylococcus aureus]MCG1466853.1 hypothetical protein [Staphylococcus epidermidis]MCG1567017.1 hypothetical protein [Staphylococcus epidermidis]NKP83785.1 hypothetical protein [Staphylococcus aureus]HCU7578021.1 hypothetical protein [Staphylococcus aureus]
MNSVLNNPFIDILENDEAELSYRYKVKHDISDIILPVVKPSKDSEKWLEQYRKDNSNLDEYDFIVMNTDNVELLTGVDKDNFLDRNPYYDIGNHYKAKCIREVLNVNNLELLNATEYDVADTFESQMTQGVSIKDFVVSEYFIDSLFNKGLVRLKVKSPFK